jgi:tRNA dimethylallyltransferase
MSDCPAVAVLGPTGSGKSSLAMVLAAEFTGEILNCDALQLYRGMDIGTAKPTAGERAAVRHHMLDLCLPGEEYSAGDYQRAGRAALDTIRSGSRLPIVAGGTGFYFRALVDGLFEGPGRSEALRHRMRSIVGKGGTARLYRGLTRVDPAAASKICPSDPVRLIRAYEVYLLTGRPLSWWWDATPTDRLSGYRWLRIAVSWPRAELYRRIDERVLEMFSLGFEREVETLLGLYPADSHAFKAIGYREVAAHLRGEISRDVAIAQIRQETRRYAKRQLTWFRRDPGILWLDASGGWEQVVAAAGEAVRSHLERL